MNESESERKARLGAPRRSTAPVPGGSVEDNSRISPNTHRAIDLEVQRLVTEQYERAHALLKDHRAAHRQLARQLLKQETVTGNDVRLALELGKSQDSLGHEAQPQGRVA